jgi:hypothetical protein
MSKMEKKHSGNNQLSDPRLAIAPNIFPRFTRPLQKTHFKSDNRVCVRGDKLKKSVKSKLALALARSPASHAATTAGPKRKKTK